MGKLLEGKVAIVTGSGRGIGRAEAIALASEGAKIVVNDVGIERDGSGGSQSPANETVAEIRKLGGQAVASYDSVADFQAAQRIIQIALDTFGQLDILVNNAGILRNVPFAEMREDDWDSVITVHLKGTFNTCRHALPVMVKQKYGRVINTTSSQWRNPEARASYAAAKGGIVSLTWDLAWEMRNYSITVNAIAPMAHTRGSMYSAEHHERLLMAGLLSNERIGQIGERPEPIYVPPMVVYLASDLASNVNGCIFRVGAGKIALYSHPSEIRGIYRDYKKDGPWPLGELVDLLPRTVLAGDTRSPHIL